MTEELNTSTPAEAASAMHTSQLKFTGQHQEEALRRADPDTIANILRTGAVRKTLIENHPIVIDQQLLITPTIEQLFNRLKKTIKFRKKGLCAYGPPGMGKTWAVTCISLMLEQAYPDIPVFNTIALQHDTFTEKTLWVDILPRGRRTRGRTAKETFEDLVALLSVAAQAKRSQVVILIVDEAQNWSAKEWRLVKGLTNKLAKSDEHNVRLILVSLGQSQITTRIQELKEEPDDGEDLRLRFFEEPHAFTGFTSMSGLKFVLHQFDSPQHSEFPEGSGICYSEFWAPLAFEAGWRLADEAGRMWLHLCEEVPGMVSISSTLVFRTLLQFLWNASEEDGIGFCGDVRRWRLAVKGLDLLDETAELRQEIERA